MSTKRARLSEAHSALNEFESASQAFLAETRRNLNDRHALTASKVQHLTQDKSKAARKRYAPVIARRWRGSTVGDSHRRWRGHARSTFDDRSSEYGKNHGRSQCFEFGHRIREFGTESSR